MKSKSQFSFVLIIITALLLGSCSPARSLNVTVTSQVTVTSIKATPEAPKTPTPKPTNAPATATKETTPTPEAVFTEISAEEISGEKAVNYEVVTLPQIQETIDAILGGESKLTSQNATLDIKINKYSDGEISANMSGQAWQSIAPRRAISYQTEHGIVKAIIYEARVKIDGVNTRIVFIGSEAGKIAWEDGYPTFTKMLQRFDTGRRVLFKAVLLTSASNIILNNPISSDLVDVVGSSANADRKSLEETGELNPQGVTIFWVALLQ